MPDFLETYLPLRRLRGAPLSCIFAMLIADRPVTHRFLVHATGYSLNEVLTALAALTVMKMIVSTPDGRWRHLAMPLNFSQVPAVPSIISRN